MEIHVSMIMGVCIFVLVVILGFGFRVKDEWSAILLALAGMLVSLVGILCLTKGPELVGLIPMESQVLELIAGGVTLVIGIICLIGFIRLLAE